MVPILPVLCSWWVGIVSAVLAKRFSLVSIELLTCQELVKLLLIVKSWSVILIILQSHPTYLQNDLMHKQHRLIQSVDTRWNSSYYMVERALK